LASTNQSTLHLNEKEPSHNRHLHENPRSQMPAYCSAPVLVDIQSGPAFAGHTNSILGTKSSRMQPVRHYLTFRDIGLQVLYGEVLPSQPQAAGSSVVNCAQFLVPYYNRHHFITEDARHFVVRRTT
jgi:hypothetical protein